MNIRESIIRAPEEGRGTKGPPLHRASLLVLKTEEERGDVLQPNSMRNTLPPFMEGEGEIISKTRRGKERVCIIPPPCPFPSSERTVVRNHLTLLAEPLV